MQLQGIRRILCCLCKHGKEKWVCRDCCGSGLCEHNRRKAHCKEQGVWWRIKDLRAWKMQIFCKGYGGKGICKHGRQKAFCMEWWFRALQSWKTGTFLKGVRCAVAMVFVSTKTTNDKHICKECAIAAESGSLSHTAYKQGWGVKTSKLQKKHHNHQP